MDDHLEQSPSPPTYANGDFPKLDAEIDKHPPAELTLQSPPTFDTGKTDKVDRILRACHESDLNSLIALATSDGGLLNDEIRRTAWPVLLGCSSCTASELDSELAWSSLPTHRDEEQVQKDVDRSFVYYPTDRSEKLIEIRKQQLSSLILEVLRRHPQLHYFQGFHDIVQVFLLVLGPEDSPLAVRRLSLLRIRDFMLPTISAAVTHLNLLPAILYAADQPLYNHLLPTNPFFALSATLTLYAHNIERYADIARLFDFLLAHDASTPIYIFASLILQQRTSLLAIDSHEDPELLHMALQRLPQPLDLERAVSRAVALRAAHPPESLPFAAWRRVSRHSVLRTTRDASALAAQSLADGAALFAAQAAEMRRRRAVDAVVRAARRAAWRYRRPAAVVGAAVAVAFAAWCVGGTARGWRAWPGVARAWRGVG